VGRPGAHYVELVIVRDVPFRLRLVVNDTGAGSKTSMSVTETSITRQAWRKIHGRSLLQPLAEKDMLSCRETSGWKRGNRRITGQPL
jgi:hypothetical protein